MRWFIAGFVTFYVAVGVVVVALVKAAAYQDETMWYE